MLMCFCNFKDGEELRMNIGQDNVWHFPVHMHRRNECFVQGGSEHGGEIITANSYISVDFLNSL